MRFRECGSMRRVSAVAGCRASRPRAVAANGRRKGLRKPRFPEKWSDHFRNTPCNASTPPLRSPRVCRRGLQSEGDRLPLRTLVSDYQKRYQVVAGEVAKAIRNGVYSAGQRLPSERDLADQFGVSRPTVREAMIALDIQGLVESRHGSGIYVRASVPREPESSELDIGAFELTEARRLFEGETAALAAATITDEEIRELEKLLKEIKEENKRKVPGERADRAFHLAIAKATRNSAIVGVVEQLWDLRQIAALQEHSR